MQKIYSESNETHKSTISADWRQLVQRL
ncbi:MAG: hypothetical protein ACI808_003335, partial [Paraglaciecola sp.]